MSKEYFNFIEELYSLINKKNILDGWMRAIGGRLSYLIRNFEREYELSNVSINWLNVFENNICDSYSLRMISGAVFDTKSYSTRKLVFLIFVDHNNKGNKSYVLYSFYGCLDETDFLNVYYNKVAGHFDPYLNINKYADKKIQDKVISILKENSEMEDN